MVENHSKKAHLSTLRAKRPRFVLQKNIWIFAPKMVNNATWFIWTLIPPNSDIWKISYTHKKIWDILRWFSNTVGFSEHYTYGLMVSSSFTSSRQKTRFFLRAQKITSYISQREVSAFFLSFQNVRYKEVILPKKKPLVNTLDSWRALQKVLVT